MHYHTTPYRVSYADTDRMGRVYYANYLVICERSRTEFLRDVGFPYRHIEAAGIIFPVRACQLRYYNYAEYDDELSCRSWIARMRHATLTFATDIFRAGSEDKPLVSATVELACMGADGKPKVIPAELRTALEPYLEG